MFDSGITVSSFIEELKNEVDVALPISNKTYILWLNALQQFLYSGIVRMQKETVIPIPEEPEEVTDEYLIGNKYTVAFEDIGQNEDEARLRFKDISHVYCGSRQLIRTTLISSKAFGDCYYVALRPKNGGDVTSEHFGFNLTDTEHTELRIMYFIRPKEITVNDKDEIESGTVKIPFEFIEMAKAYVRHHAYMITNEFSIAANWLQMYNAQLESFKEWLSINYPEFGI